MKRTTGLIVGVCFSLSAHAAHVWDSNAYLDTTGNTSAGFEVSLPQLPTGEVIVGLAFRVKTSNITTMRVHSRTLGSGGLGSSTITRFYGSSPNHSVEVDGQCPSGQVVVGVALASNSENMNNMRLDCAPIIFYGGGPAWDSSRVTQHHIVFKPQHAGANYEISLTSRDVFTGNPAFFNGAFRGDLQKTWLVGFGAGVRSSSANRMYETLRVFNENFLPR